MRLSNIKLPVRMSMDASGTPVQSVKIINQNFDLSTTDIPVLFERIIGVFSF